MKYRNTTDMVHIFNSKDRRELVYVLPGGEFNTSGYELYDEVPNERDGYERPCWVFTERDAEGLRGFGDGYVIAVKLDHDAALEILKNEYASGKYWGGEVESARSFYKWRVLREKSRNGEMCDSDLDDCKKSGW